MVFDDGSSDWFDLDRIEYKIIRLGSGRNRPGSAGRGRRAGGAGGGGGGDGGGGGGGGGRFFGEEDDRRGRGSQRGGRLQRGGSSRLQVVADNM